MIHKWNSEKYQGLVFIDNRVMLQSTERGARERESKKERGGGRERKGRGRERERELRNIVSFLL